MSEDQWVFRFLVVTLGWIFAPGAGPARRVGQAAVLAVVGFGGWTLVLLPVVLIVWTLWEAAGQPVDILVVALIMLGGSLLSVPLLVLGAYRFFRGLGTAAAAERHEG